MTAQTRRGRLAASLTPILLCGLLAGCAVEAEPWLGAALAATAVGAVAAAAVVQLRTPMLGLGLLLAAGVAVPFEFPIRGGFYNACPFIAVLVCGAFVLRVFASRGRVALDGGRLVRATLAFAATAVLAFLVGQYPWFPIAHAPMVAQISGLGIFLLSVGVLLAVGHELTGPKQLEQLTWLFVGLGAFAIVTSESSIFQLSVGGVAFTNAASIGSAFWTWLVAISLGQALFNASLSPATRAAVGGVAALALARGLLLAFDWASGWLPPLVAAVVLLGLKFPRTTLASGLVGLAPALVYGGRALNAWMATESYSVLTRVEALRVMWQVLQREPWLGFGPANYYHYTQLFPILGWWVPFNSHNNYIDLVGQIGLIGLLAFGWLMVEVLALGWRLRRRVRGGFERAYVAGAIAGLAGGLASGLLADWILPFTYNIGVRGFRSSMLFWFFLGGLLALKRTTAPFGRAARPAWRPARAPVAAVVKGAGPAADWPFDFPESVPPRRSA